MNSFSKELLSTYDGPALWKEPGLLGWAGHCPCPHEAHILLGHRHHQQGACVPLKIDLATLCPCLTQISLQQGFDSS